MSIMSFSTTNGHVALLPTHIVGIRYYEAGNGCPARMVIETRSNFHHVVECDQEAYLMAVDVWEAGLAR